MLYRAIERGSAAQVAEYIKLGTPPDVADSDGLYTPVEYAIHRHRFDLVRVMVAHCPRLVKYRDEEGDTIAHLAAGCYTDDYRDEQVCELVRCLFAVNEKRDVPVDMFQRNYWNESIITLCCMYDKPKTLEFVLSKRRGLSGADFIWFDKFNAKTRDVVEEAIRYQSCEVLSVLVKCDVAMTEWDKHTRRGSLRRLLMLALETNDDEVIEPILRYRLTNPCVILDGQLLHTHFRLAPRIVGLIEEDIERKQRLRRTLTLQMRCYIALRALDEGDGGDRVAQIPPVVAGWSEAWLHKNAWLRKGEEVMKG